MLGETLNLVLYREIYGELLRTIVITGTGNPNLMRYNRNIGLSRTLCMGVLF